MTSEGLISGELSSISAQIEDLISRVEKILETSSSSNRTDGGTGLLEVERHLRSTLRELNRLMQEKKV
ncbi:MAG TPA: hypothetical protein QF762_08195 [Acidimicrobiales bacterium]|nr:hypothetical protein [Acidimicrobiales bacterium]|tara:strand:+ start:226 stop:429 length:204 start_codon:yes stop_codon:yes gene_type:complete